MIISDILTTAERALQSPTARLDAELLLSFVLDKDRSWLHAHSDENIDSYIVDKFKKLIKRRSHGEPIAYINSSKEFYGRQFYVNPRVLVPRPESEEIIVQLLSLAISKEVRIADIGCGSGALGITAKLELNNSTVTLIDIDADALAIAKKNARKHGIRAQFYQGDLINAWPSDYDYLLCNLPYVPVDYPVNIDAGFEPTIALYGGTDGLDLYRKLFDQIASRDISKPVVITEALPNQHSTLCDIARKHGYVQDRKSELVQVFIPTAQEQLQE